MAFKRYPINPPRLRPAEEPVIAPRSAHRRAYRPVTPPQTLPPRRRRQLAPHKRGVVQLIPVKADRVHPPTPEILPVNHRHPVIKPRIPVDIRDVDVRDVHTVVDITRVAEAAVIPPPVPRVVPFKRRQRHPTPVAEPHPDPHVETAPAAPPEKAHQRRTPEMPRTLPSRPPAPAQPDPVKPPPVVIRRPAPRIVAHPRPPIIVNPTPPPVAIRRPAPARRRHPHLPILRRVHPPPVPVQILDPIDIPAHIPVALTPLQVPVPALAPTVKIVERHRPIGPELRRPGLPTCHQRPPAPQPLAPLRRKDLRLPAAHRHLGRPVAPHRYPVAAPPHRPHRNVRRGDLYLRRPVPQHPPRHRPRRQPHQIAPVLNVGQPQLAPLGQPRKVTRVKLHLGPRPRAGQHAVLTQQRRVDGRCHPLIRITPPDRHVPGEQTQPRHAAPLL